MLKNIWPAFLLMSGIIFGQEKIEFVSIETVTEEVIDKIGTEDYKGAIASLDRIKKNDTSYCSVLSSKSYYQLQLEEYDAVIETADKGIALGCYDAREIFYINKLAAFISQENFEGSIALADKAIEEYPMNATLWYNKAYAFEQLEKYQEAAKSYQESIFREPSDPLPHVKLGNLYYKQDKKAQALMAFNMYLMLLPNPSDNFQVLRQLNSIAATPSNEKIDNVALSEDDAAFDEINLILNQKVALSKGYDTGNRMEIDLVKQNHALMTKLKKFKGKGGFWSEKYVPLYQWIMESGSFDAFSYTLAYSVENETLQRLIKRNEKDIETFLPAAYLKWQGLLQENNSFVYEYNDSYIVGKGGKTGQLPSGDWRFFDENGRIFAEGPFDKKGERTGLWTYYYDNGNVKEKLNFKNGKKQDGYSYYHYNGKIGVKASYKDDELDGTYVAHNDRGALTHELTYKNGEIDGRYLSYFNVGKPTLEYDMTYKNGEVEGEVLEYHLNGAVYSKTQAKKGKKEGKEIFYYSNGAISKEATYTDDLLNGPFVAYFKNGKVKEEGIYKDDKAHALWKSYYYDGTLASETVFDDGEVDGISKKYAPTGVLQLEYDNRRGNIIAYKFYDQEGKLIKEAKKRGGEFNYESYSPYGIKLMEGNYDVDGGKDGLWTYYNDNGVLQAKGTYTENKAQGEYFTYFTNGEIESVSTYKDDILDGYYTYFYPDKTLRSQGWYVEGQEQGDWKFYYPDGNLSFHAFYNKGKYHGDQIRYAVDGSKDKISHYDNGDLEKETIFDAQGNEMQTVSISQDKETYEVVYTFPNGKPFQTYTYKNGYRHGPYTEQNLDGLVITEGQYVQGLLHGDWKYKYRDGKKLSNATYELDKLEGEYTRYHENGTVSTEAQYQDGKYNGVYNSYHENGTKSMTEFENMSENHGRKENYGEQGNLQLVRFYEHGRLIGYSYLDTNGEEVPMIPIENETAVVKSYYDNGTLARHFEYKLGELQGSYKTYHYNGALQYETHYKDDNLYGSDIKYKADGTPRKELNYQNDLLHGMQKSYYENGTLRDEVPYKFDLIHGVAKYYDESGKLVKMETYRDGVIIKIEKV